MEKSRLWNLTEEAFMFLTALNRGTSDEKALAADALTTMLPKVVSPGLRNRITLRVREFKNGKIIETMRAS